LAPYDFIALLESAFALTVLARLLIVGDLPHGFLSFNHGSTYWETKQRAGTAKSLKEW
jgi:formate hydrogenlyase subunit 4